MKNDRIKMMKRIDDIYREVSTTVAIFGDPGFSVLARSAFIRKRPRTSIFRFLILRLKIMKLRIARLAAAFLLVQTTLLPVSLTAQIAIEPVNKRVEPKQIMPESNSTIGRYLDMANGTTADDAVRTAIENNGEIAALRDELDASNSLIKQARLRPNPSLQISGSQESIVGNRYSGMASVSLPLELGGRRNARIDVAKQQFEVRQAILADKERVLAAEVRMKFGRALALIEKLNILEEMLANVEQGYKLISAKVTEGSNSPLEKNMSVVELNRVRSMREMATANVEIELLELRNTMGIESSEPLRLQGDFENLLDGISARSSAAPDAVSRRPDLESLRRMVGLGDALLEQARSEGRIDAGVSLGVQRMTRVMPMVTNQNPVELTPKLVGENFVTFGIDLMLPVRNKNQGAIEASAFEIQAAKKRLDFGELTVRREVAAAFVRFERAGRAMAIYQVGVRNQAKQNLAVVWQTYDLGDKSLIEYIGEERRYFDLENDLIEAKLEVYLARVEIERATNAPGLVVK